LSQAGHQLPNWDRTGENHLWYIIPEPVFRGQASVALRPEIKDSKYAKYLGAWELMKNEEQPSSEL
jgi:hypothetical protein